MWRPLLSWRCRTPHGETLRNLAPSPPKSPSVLVAWVSSGVVVRAASSERVNDPLLLDCSSKSSVNCLLRLDQVVEPCVLSVFLSSPRMMSAWAAHARSAFSLSCVCPEAFVAPQCRRSFPFGVSVLSCLEGWNLAPNDAWVWSWVVFTFAFNFVKQPFLPSGSLLRHPLFQSVHF